MSRIKELLLSCSSCVSCLNFMFQKILIANRGEIACRVIRACREMRIKTVAVYSEADRDALHVRMADEAYFIGAPPSSESYLRGEKILEVAKKSGAEAIHPGYGFLSENAEFVRQVTDEGITFIGPSPEAMEAMGGKISARKIAIKAKVPVVPGTTEPLTSAEDALETALEFGFPVMLKASAGGGGKGMRLVENEDDLKNALKRRNRKLSKFRTCGVILKKRLFARAHRDSDFADTHGNYAISAKENVRFSRRHQKVIEEWSFAD